MYLNNLFNTRSNSKAAYKVISILKRLILLTAAILSVFLLTACKPETKTNEIEKIQKKERIVVGTLYGTTTYYLTPDGPTGFEYELVKAFADYLKVDLVMRPVYDLNELFRLLDNNKVDFLAANLIKTPKRLENYRFSPSYLTVTEKLIYKQGIRRPRKWQDLKGELVVTANSSYQETIETTAPEDVIWQATNEQDAEELIQAVLNEEIDYTIVNSNLLNLNRRFSPNLSVGFSVSGDQDVAWVFNSEFDDSLLEEMINFLGQFHEEEAFAQLEDKYFGHIRDFDYVDTRQFLRAIESKLPKYQDWFIEYAEQYKIDWRLLAAQSYQESHWNPHAKSPTGVRGIMMLTQPTAKSVGVTNRLEPEQNIRGGAQYLSSLMNRVPARIEEPDKTWFALAAYNIGLGHLEDARRITQKQGGNPDKWHQVKERLPLLQKKAYYKYTRYGFARGNEAVNYVENIRRYYDSLSWFYSIEANRQPTVDLKNMPQTPVTEIESTETTQQQMKKSSVSKTDNEADTKP